MKYLGYKTKALTKKHPHFLFTPQYKENEYIGVEFEIEGMKLPQQSHLTKYWEVKIDESLRVPKGGNAFEYVLTRPVSPEYFADKCLPFFRKAMTKKRAEPLWSARCSVHVHVGVHELYYYQVFLFVGLFFLLEELFIPLTGEERDGNLFCISSLNSEFIVEQVNNLLHDDIGSHYFTNNGLKYSSCNLQTLRNLGTVEFRSMEGNLSPKRINTWIEALSAMRNYAAKLEPSNALEFIEGLSSKGTKEMLEHVFGRDSKTMDMINTQYNKTQLDRIVFEGVGRVQSLFYGFDWSSIEVAKDAESVKKPRKRGGPFISDGTLNQFYNFSQGTNVIDAS